MFAGICSDPRPHFPVGSDIAYFKIRILPAERRRTNLVAPARNNPIHPQSVVLDLPAEKRPVIPQHLRGERFGVVVIRLARSMIVRMGTYSRPR